MDVEKTKQTLDILNNGLDTSERLGEVWFTLTELFPSMFKGFLEFKSNPSAPNDLPQDDEANLG